MAMTALIVDDERLAREELKYLLDSAGGVEVIAQGENGIEAVHLIHTHHPDVVFLDVQMPGLDGFAVLKKLLERVDADRMPQIIFATAFDQYAVRAFDVNAIDYLLKPFDRARVLQALERARQRLQEMHELDAEPPAENGTDLKPSDARLDALLQSHGTAALFGVRPGVGRLFCRPTTGSCWPIRRTSVSPPSRRESSPW